MKTFKLEIEVPGRFRKIKLSVEELKQKFKVHTLSITMQCAGNRRVDMGRYKPVKGLSWTHTAISNAEYTGVMLVDVLKYAGVKEEDYGHVIFKGLDADVAGECFEASIPIETAMDPKREVLIAFEMNGETMPLDHGFPLRMMVPGNVGARNVKWLYKIVPSKNESVSHWHAKDYKTFTPSTGWDKADFSKAVAIQEYPLQSAICEPKEGKMLDDDVEVTVKGYAWSGGNGLIIHITV